MNITKHFSVKKNGDVLSEQCLNLRRNFNEKTGTRFFLVNRKKYKN